jgi:hypothetical protein
MLKSIKEFRGYQIKARDGDIGKVHEFLFNDEYWPIIYMVVDTGNWLSERKVLISPLEIGRPDWKTQSVPVNLTKEQIESSPDIDTDMPVSRQNEIILHKHYSWPYYWTGSGLPGTGSSVAPPAAYQPLAGDSPSDNSAQDDGSPHLRSTREVIGYRIQAHDGSIGHVEDFIVDDDVWLIRYVVIDTRNWLPGKKVMLSTQWIESIDWNKSEMVIDLPRGNIKNSPEYDPNTPVNREYEERLYDFYGRPKYWV